MTDVLVVCSPGGHFTEAISLMSDIRDVNFKYVLHLPPELSPELRSRIIIAPHAERDIRVLKQMFFALYCVWKERPKVIVSTGALIGVTFGLAGKLFGAKFIFIESLTRVTQPSLAGRICYKFVDTMYVRHESLIRFYPEAICTKKI
jgi:UDP-N-acetylglucosamine:LPS N-acetylglucosamine transferase